MRYKRYGWFNESARHSLAAKGIKTSFSKKSPGRGKPFPWDLPEGPDRDIRMKELEEIEIRKNIKDKPAGVPVGEGYKPIPQGKINNILLKPKISRKEAEMIKEHYGEEKGEEILEEHGGYSEDKESFALIKKVDPNAPTIFEAFKSPEEKSDVGKGMMQRVVDNKLADVEDKMAKQDLSFEDKRRIMDHQVYPIVERFKNGNMSEEQFNSDVDSKVDHNSKIHSRSGSFMDFGTSKDEIDKNGTGAFNFIDKAQKSSFSAKDPRTKKLTLGDRVFGFGVIGSAMTIETMGKDSTYVKEKK